MARREVSVVIPAFNAGRYLRSALGSVLGQTWPAVEIIVVDDGSSDSSCEILREYGERYGIIWIAQRNKGVGGARNSGIKAASGRYLLFLDSDDYFSRL